MDLGLQKVFELYSTADLSIELICIQASRFGLYKREVKSFIDETFSKEYQLERIDRIRIDNHYAYLKEVIPRGYHPPNWKGGIIKGPSGEFIILKPKAKP